MSGPDEKELDVQVPCGHDKAQQGLLGSDSFEGAWLALAEEPGFIDLVVEEGEDGLVATAWFDRQVRADPLPSQPAMVDGVPVRFMSDEFIPLPFFEENDLDLAFQPIPLSPCAQEIRPGARMNSPVGCTYNFVYTDQFGRYYIGTAGHCGVPTTGIRVSAAGIGTFGTVVFTTGSGGVGNDFALIRVDTDKEHLVNPEMCHWGGPDRPATAASVYLHHYGHGIGYGLTEQTRARTGSLGAMGSTSFQFTGAAIFGDSGSGAVTSSGAALGTITHIGAGTGNVFGTRGTHGIALAESATGLQFNLETAPFNGIV